MIDPNRREMFSDLYRLAECYENPQLKPGDIDGNAEWFVLAQEKWLKPFLTKYQENNLAINLALAVLDDASEKAAAANKEAPV